MGKVVGVWAGEDRHPGNEKRMSSLGNTFIKAILNSPFHWLLGRSFGVITVYGRKTGKAYSTPINVTPDQGSYTATSTRERTWWRNLRQDQPANLRVAGQSYTVRGKVMERQEEVVEAFERYFKKHPTYTRRFGIQRAADGTLMPKDMHRIARERVVIILTPKEQTGRSHIAGKCLHQGDHFIHNLRCRSTSFSNRHTWLRSSRSASRAETLPIDIASDSCCHYSS